jgi:hypothetical protein
MQPAIARRTQLKLIRPSYSSQPSATFPLNSLEHRNIVFARTTAPHYHYLALGRKKANYRIEEYRITFAMSAFLYLAYFYP